MTMQIKKPQRILISTQIVREMERLMSSGEWAVGSRIPSEPELVKLFGASRNTVREALQSLIHAGLLNARPGDGTYVQRSTRLAGALHNELADADLEQVLAARLTLELGIADLAAQNRTDEDLSALEEALFKRNQSDNAALDAEFHTQVAMATHNPLLANFYNEICKYMLKNLPATPLEGEQYQAETTLHNQLFEAIKAQDSQRSQQICRAIVKLYAQRFGVDF